MKSKKDEGNKYFKEQKYTQAIQCYKQYVKGNNPDNSKAYSNMALGCFKLKIFQDCVHACQMAIQMQPQFQKPYFRMYEAYRQLKNNYGMIIAGAKFSKLSKEEKQIKAMQKQLVKVRQDLSFSQAKDCYSPESQKIILQIISLAEQSQQSECLKKEPQTSLQSKWQNIESIIKNKKQEGLNLARRFLSCQCTDQALKQKYKKISIKLRNDHTNEANKDYEHIKSNNEDVSDSNEQQPKVEQLQKYTAQKKQRQRQRQRQKQTQTQKQRQKQNQNQKQEHLQLNHQHDKIQVQQTESYQQVDQLQKQTQQKPLGQQQGEFNNKQTKNQTQTEQLVDGKWQDFVSEEQGEELFSIYVKSQMQKADDQFDCFFKCLTNVIGSTELNKFQKQAILSIIPDKVKKFSMIMKSYTQTQKQHLTQLFTQNNLHPTIEALYLKR